MTAATEPSFCRSAVERSKGKTGTVSSAANTSRTLSQSVALFQSEQQAEDFGGEVDPEQDQSHQQP